jgi:hypothetical protein
LRKGYYLNKYLNETDKGNKLIYAYKGGLSQIELDAGYRMLEDFRRTPRRLAMLPITFIVIETARIYYFKVLNRK